MGNSVPCFLEPLRIITIFISFLCDTPFSVNSLNITMRWMLFPLSELEIEQGEAVKFAPITQDVISVANFVNGSSLISEPVLQALLPPL